MLIAALTLALSSSFQAPQESASKGDSQLVEVTYLANAGFLIRSGSGSVLIDAFVPRAMFGLEALDTATRRNLLGAKAPFDRPAIALVSHTHPDHFKAPFAHQAMVANEKLMLLGSEEMLRAVSKAGKKWDLLTKRVGAFRRDAQNRPQPLLDPSKDLSILFLDLPHVKSEKESIENIGHLVRLGNFKFLHLGDAAADFQALMKHGLADKKIDVAFVPYWFYSSEEGVRAIDEAIAARYVVVYHIPIQDKQNFSNKLKENNPDAIIFSQSMERKIFEIGKRK